MNELVRKEERDRMSEHVCMCVYGCYLLSLILYSGLQCYRVYQAIPEEMFFLITFGISFSNLLCML